MSKVIMTLTLFAVMLSTVGCATKTGWKDEGGYYKSVQSYIEIKETDEYLVLVDNQYVGKTPLRFPFTYEQLVEKKTRKVSYWVTQPGLSVLLSILSLGTYLPFSVIPVDIETSLYPVERFRKNVFDLSLSREGGEWKGKVELSGENLIISKSYLVQEER